jgi:WD40 repeat protein
MKWDIMAIIFKNFSLNEIIELNRYCNNKTFKEKLLQLIHSNHSFTKCVQSILHNTEIQCILQLTDGRILTGHSEHPICVWDKDTFEPIDIIKSSYRAENIMQINNTAIVTLHLKRQINIWQVDSDKIELVDEVQQDIEHYYSQEIYCLTKINNHTIAYYTACAFEDFGLDGGEGEINFVDVNTSECIASYNTGWVKVIALLKISVNYLILSFEDGVLELRDLSNELKNLSSIKREISDYIFEAPLVRQIAKINNKLFATGSADGKIMIYGLFSKEMKLVRTLDAYASVNSLILLKDGRLVSESSTNMIVWNLEFEVEYVLEKPNTEFKQVIQLKDGRIVSISDDRTIDIWR